MEGRDAPRTLERMDFITASHIGGRNNVVQIVTCTGLPSLLFFISLSLSLSLSLDRIYTGNAFSRAPLYAVPENEETKLEPTENSGNYAVRVTTNQC